MVSVGRHKNIQLLSYSEVKSISGYVGNFKAKIERYPRYIDEEKCTGCGKCAQACPVDTVNTFDFGISTRKAAYRHSAQAVPGAFVIEKKGIAPCRDACPTDQRAQGYIALLRRRRYADAYWAIRREHPFPSVCGRVCNHACEDACSRGNYDEPVNIMGLKRFISDWAYEHRSEIAYMQDKSLVGSPFKSDPKPTGKKIAIIGAGPAGLTAALDLVRLGHKVTVYDSLPIAGGMMRVGIPPHRLPHEYLDWEIQQILDEGVELVLNTWVDDIASLLENGYDAALIATGAHVANKLPIRNSNHPDNLMSLDILRKACLGEGHDVAGKKVVVLGGGNVALDTARTVLRLGASEVRLACLEPRGEMPGFNWEILVAVEEGIEICPGRTFHEIMVENDRITGIRCSSVIFQGFKRSRPVIDIIPDSEHILPADIVVWAIGQRPDFSFLPLDGSINTSYPIGIQSNEEMLTTKPGVFVAGDVRRGVTFFVVDAIGEGHKAARSIDRFLRGEQGIREPSKPPVIHLDAETIEYKLNAGIASRTERVPIKSTSLDQRHHNFEEVDLSLTEEEALAEAERCLRCGICSECLECVVACERGAIDHNMQSHYLNLDVGTIVLATGFKDFDPRVVPELGYGQTDNVITAMEFERLINSGGPTEGQVTLKNGQVPKSVAILHCIGSRDDRYHDYCSRACCMYSLKFAQLVHDYVDAEVYEIYRDMRTFGKDYEEFYNRTRVKGVNFYHGKIKSIQRQNGKLLVSWGENFYNQPDSVAVDMVILATGFEPQDDTADVAKTFGISRSRDGFFLERHPKLAPIETATEGIYLAGACQSPKDIPDSVVQAGAAAAAALSLMDQGTINMDPSIAHVDMQLCAGCGQCVNTCPYEAISLQPIDNRGQVASVNSYLCKGCGTCAASCPNKAMTLIHYDDQQIISEIVGALQPNTPIVPELAAKSR